MKKVYLDYAATTPVDPKVVKIMNAYHSDIFGNAASLHSFGRDSAKALDEAREKVAKFLSCDFHEVIFTGGATEANNLAILGLIKKFVLKDVGKKFHVITSAIEHSSVLETFKHIEEVGLAEVTILPVDSSGIISVESVQSAIRANTILISIMYANNEIGTIQPIREIGKLVKKVNEERPEGPFQKLYFHTDAVQAGNYLNMNVLQLHVDLLTISGHKLYGPKGVGALYVRSGTPLENITYGGDQELSLRPGTHNIPAIVGFGEACALLTQEFKDKEVSRLTELRNDFINDLKKDFRNATLNGDLENRLPNNINISIPGISGETLLYLLDQQGIAVSTGSACASGGVEPSHVLLALGKSATEAKSSLRLTLGRKTTSRELKYVREVLKGAIKTLKK